MTVADAGGPYWKLTLNLGPVDETAQALGDHAEAVAERTRLLVLNETLGSSFGIRDTDAADSYRNVAEAFGDVANLLRAELNRGQWLLSTVTREYRATDADNAAVINQAVDGDATGDTR